MYHLYIIWTLFIHNTVFEIDGNDKLQVEICENLSSNSIENVANQLMIEAELREVVMSWKY